MRILKKAKQKNFRLNKDWYTSTAIEKLASDGVIDNITFDYPIIYADKCSEIKVIYHKEYECYLTIVILHDGRELAVEI